MVELQRLEAERQGHKAAAEACEAKALAALRADSRAGWEFWAHEADLAWQCNAWVVGEIDRLTEAAA